MKPAPPRAACESERRWADLIMARTARGAIVGGSLGSLAYAYWTDAGAVALVVGSISAAILGGFFGFAASSFLTMILSAWRQALNEG